MGLVSFVLTLPLAPVRGVLSLARVIEQRAEEELYDPARVRRRLEEIEEAVASGEMRRDEAEWAQARVLEPVVAPSSPGAPRPPGPPTSPAAPRPPGAPTSPGAPSAPGAPGQADSDAGREHGTGAGRQPESAGSDFVTVRSEDADEDAADDDVADDDTDVTEDRGAAGNDFVTLRGGDRDAGQEPDPAAET